jgi:hypothetical protein
MDYKIYFKQYKTARNILRLKKLDEQELIRLKLESQIPSVKAQVITDMPTIHNDESPVERFAVKSEEEQQRLDMQISELQKDIYKLQREVAQAEGCLDILGNVERFVIEQYYLEELKWPLLADAYQCRYKKYLNVNQLIIIRNDALKKVERYLEQAKIA